jgi:GNAT superfamily N-acetyltransferase
MIPRRLALADMAEAARVHRAAFDARLPWLASLHTPEEDRTFFQERVFTVCEVWGVGPPGALEGFIAWRAGWIDQLYVRPDMQGRGVGVALLQQAQATEPRLQLWTFERNTAARRFYERHGFAAAEFTDGAGNEAREPDVRYVWSASGSS